MTRDRYPSIRRLTDDAITLLHPRKSCVSVVCVKFSNLTMVLGNDGGEPPVSVAAIAARRVDRLQLLEVELGNGVQLRRQPRSFEAGRKVVEPRRYSSWRSINAATAAAQRVGRGGVLPAQPGAVAPGVGLGSLVRRRSEVWSCSQLQQQS
jgi:hypothetical protein